MSEQPGTVDESPERQERDDMRNDRRSTNRPEKSDNSKESAIWYEYGCV